MYIRRIQIAMLGIALILIAAAQAQPASGPDPVKLQADLCAAIGAGDAKAVAAALDKGAKLDRDCPEQMTPPLLFAVDTGKAEIVTLLLDRGSDVNQKDRGVSATALHYAAQKHDAAMVKLLVKRGGNVKALTDEGLSPLALAVSESDDTATVQALIDAGADLNAADEQGDTILDTAVLKGHKQVAALLESKGAKRGDVPSVPPSTAATKPMPAAAIGDPSQAATTNGNRTKDGKLIFKGFYLGMQLRDAVERFRAAGFPPDEVPDEAIGKKPEERIIVRTTDGSLVVRHKSFFLNGWMVQATADGRVTRIVIAAKAVNAFFDAENAADQEFFGGFISGYGLENGIHAIQVKVWSDVRIPELHAPESCGAIEYIDPSGWYITLNDFRDIDYGESASRPRVKFD